MINKILDTQLVEEKISSIFKVLSNESRRLILTVLRDGEECVCHIQAYTGLGQAYISQQLKVLKDAGVIIDRRSGWNIYYSVATPKIFEILDDVAVLANASDSGPASAAVKIELCSCPKCKQIKKNSIN